jgi:hypothetical protein
MVYIKIKKSLTITEKHLKLCTLCKSVEQTFVMLVYVLSHIRILFAKTTATFWGSCWQLEQTPAFVSWLHTAQFIVAKYCEIVLFLSPWGTVVGKFGINFRGMSAYLKTQVFQP